MNLFDTTIVYLTYGQDLPWLNMSLYSVRKYVRNYKDIVIYCHDQVIDDLNRVLSLYPELKISKVIPVTYNYHGYIKSMVTRCFCFRDIESEYYMFVDCDCEFTTRFEPEQLTVGDRICYSYVPFAHGDPNWLIYRTWQTAYEAMTLEPQKDYFLANDFPHLFTRKSLENACNKFIELHGKDYEEFAKERCAVDPSFTQLQKFDELCKVFIDFEYLGWFCLKYEETYRFTKKSKQEFLKFGCINHWSHGGQIPQIGQQPIPL